MNELKGEELNGWVYVLHFDSPFWHARHYVGCTQDPIARLARHGSGQGSNIVRAAQKVGIGFVLGALAACEVPEEMRKVEAWLKRQKGVEGFCEVCCGTGDAKRIKGTTPFPVCMVTGQTEYRGKV